MYDMFRLSTYSAAYAQPQDLLLAKATSDSYQPAEYKAGTPYPSLPRLPATGGSPVLCQTEINLFAGRENTPPEVQSH